MLHKIKKQIPESNVKTAFRLACINNRLQIAMWMYTVGLNIYDVECHSFITACGNGYIELAKWLYSVGLDICVDRNSIIYILYKIKCHSSIRYLHRFGFDKYCCYEDAFAAACKNSQIEIINWLCDLDVDKSIAFKLACCYGHIEIAERLYQLNSDIYVRNDYTFINACSYNHVDVAKWLYTLGADIHAENDLAFINACSNGNFEIAKWLYTLGANIHTVNELAFISACRNNRVEIVEWLCDLGVNVETDNGLALSEVCLRGHTEIVKLLIQHGADILINDNKPFKNAIKCGRFKLANYLYQTDNRVLSEYIINNNVDFSIFDINTETRKMINLIRTGQKLPETVQHVEDIVIYVLFKFNRTDDLERLNPPNVRYDVIKNTDPTGSYIKKFIVNGEIVKYNAKSARNI